MAADTVAELNTRTRDPLTRAPARGFHGRDGAAPGATLDTAATDRCRGTLDQGELKTVDTDQLAGALNRAADARGLHEKELGRLDPDLPRRYAGRHRRTA